MKDFNIKDFKNQKKLFAAMQASETESLMQLQNSELIQLDDEEPPLDNVNLDLEVEQKSSEMSELETESIKKRGDMIAKS